MTTQATTPETDNHVRIYPAARRVWAGIEAKVKANTTAGLLTGEAMTGPETGHDRRCMRCHKLIARGEAWRKVSAPDGSYAVAIHEACRG